MSLKYRARRENKKENNQNRKVIWFNPPYNMQVSTNIAKCFFNLLDQNFVNNIDYTRSLIEIMLRLVTHAQKICPVLFHFIIKNYLIAAQENHLQKPGVLFFS